MTQLIESVLGGGGEMGERIRALDWSTTPLGPLERWPQSLKISVRIMLDSGYPMAICWGRDYTLLYNDAQRSMFGAKHPAALGRSARDVFAEAWESVGQLFEAVLIHGQAYTLPPTSYSRAGRPADTVQDFANWRNSVQSYRHQHR